MKLFAGWRGRKRLLLCRPYLSIIGEHLHLNVRCLGSIAPTSSVKPNVFDFEKAFRTGTPPDFFNFASDVFDSHVVNSPSKLALWVENDSHSKQWSFSQLQTESVRAAISLQRVLNGQSEDVRSLKYFRPSPATNIFVLLSRVPKWWFLALASLRLGTIFCPATTQLTPADIASRLKASRPTVVVTDDENMWKIEEAQRLENFPPPKKIVVPKKRRFEQMTAENWLQYDELAERVTDSDVLAFRNTVTRSSDISQLFFTSGTTGKPKAVAHSNSYGIGHYHSTRLMRIQPNDIYWNISDPGWAKAAYGNLFSPWIAGAGVYIHQMERFEVKKILDVLRTRPISGFCAPATMYHSLVQENDAERFKFMALKYSLWGGEACNFRVVQAWKEKSGVHLEGLYGQTETTVVMGYAQGDKRKDHSMGLATWGYDVRITDDDGVEVPRGSEGNIAIRVKPKRPIGFFKGYLKEESTSIEIQDDHHSFVGDFYLTGDLGIQDDEGHFYFIGRSDDVIISAGYRIGPFEVESVLQKHPAVAENVVVSSPHPGRGAVVKAFIILAKEFRNHDKEELTKNIQNFCKAQTAPYKYPRRIEFVEELPKTISGKTLRRELKAREDVAHREEILELTREAYAKDHEQKQ